MGRENWLMEYEAGDPKMVANWVINELLRELKGEDKGKGRSPDHQRGLEAGSFGLNP